MTAKRVFVASLFAALIAAGSANGDDRGPKVRHTPSGMVAAQSVLLSARDLGGTWTSSTSSSSNPTCGITMDLQPQESNLLETGFARSPLFTNKYEAITQNAQVFATPRQAQTAWSRTNTKNLVICMEQQVEGTSSMMTAVSVTDWNKIRLPKSTGRAAAYRVVASAKVGPRKSNVYLDLILLQDARTVTRISLSSLKTPFSPHYEGRLAQLVSERLHAHR